MRILLVTKKVPFPTHDGESIALRNMLDQYLAIGWEVEVLCMRTPKHPYGQQVPETYHSVTFHTVQISNNPTYWGAFKNLFQANPYHAKRFTSPRFRLALVQLIKQTAFDVIQLEGLYLLPYIPDIRKESKALVIYRSHNIEGNIWERLSMLESRPLHKWYMHRQAQRLLQYERKQVEFVDFILAISLADTAAYKQYLHNSKVVFLPTGFEPVAEENNSVNAYWIYFIGALDWRPNLQGVQRFIRHIWPIVYSNQPKAQFHIAGRHAPAGFADHLPEGIYFHGEVEDALSFIRDKSICIIPLWAGSGLKIKLVEALSASKPVITTTIGIEGVPEGVEAYCGVADENDGMAGLILDYFKRWPEPKYLAEQAAEEIRNSLSNDAVRKQLVLTLKKWELI